MKKNIKHLLILLVFVSILPFLGGCSSKQEPKSADNSNITIGFSIHGLDMSRWKREKSMAEEYAKKEGFNLLVADAQKDPQKQIKQCENLIYQGVKALIIIPEDDKALGKVAQLAKENIFTFNRL